MRLLETIIQSKQKSTVNGIIEYTRYNVTMSSNGHQDTHFLLFHKEHYIHSFSYLRKDVLYCTNFDFPINNLIFNRFFCPQFETSTGAPQKSQN